MADLPPAPRRSLLLPQGGSYSTASPLHQGWQALQLQQPGILPCPCQRKEEIRTGRGRTGSWDTGDITGSAVPLVLAATSVYLHLAPAFPEYHTARSPALSVPRPGLHERGTSWQHHPAITPLPSPACVQKGEE